MIAGDIAGHKGPGSTRTPISLLHVTLSPGAELRLPWPAGFNGLVYGLSGAGSVGHERRPLQSGQLAVTGNGDVLTIGGATRQDSRTPAFDVLVLGGRPIGEPIAWQGPFVMNTHAELAQAFEDFQRGRMGTVPAGALGRR